MVSFPNAKINLGLHVVAKRPDGYHEIETCFCPISWSDILEILPAEKFEFRSTGKPIPGNIADNLCVKAFELLKKDFDLPPVLIHLHKIVPMGAGLGGGSSDAAWTLKLLNETFNLSLSTERLSEYASALGSDCAFFIQDKPKIGKGRGNELFDVEIKGITGMFVVVVKPPIHVSTAEAYAGVRPSAPELELSAILQAGVHQWKNFLKNDFEQSVFKKYDEIARIKDKLYSSGAFYSSMSGSGSAVYGIFSSPVNLKEQFPNAEYWSGFLK